MKKYWWGLLALALTACGKQVEIASDVAIKHRYDVGLQRQIELLQAEQVKVSATAGGTGPAVLSLEVINPLNQPAQLPDTLKQRMRKLAHLLVVDLAHPDRYQVVTAQAVFKQSRFSLGGGQSSSQAFIYPIASLR